MGVVGVRFVALLNVPGVPLVLITILTVLDQKAPIPLYNALLDHLFSLLCYWFVTDFIDWDRMTRNIY